MNILVTFFSSLPLSALAASGGQLPLSSLEGASKVVLGASGGQGGSLPSSLFLNHPALLHMGQNPGAGLISATVAKASQPSPFPSASSISPTPCSPSPCSSPASSCSSSEMAHSPPSLGGTKIEWPHQGPIREEEEGGNGNLAFHTKATLSLYCALLPLFFSQRLSLSFSPNLSMPKIHRMKEERGRERSERGENGKKKIETKNLYLSKQMGRSQRGTFLSITWYQHGASLVFLSERK